MDSLHGTEVLGKTGQVRAHLLTATTQQCGDSVQANVWKTLTGSTEDHMPVPSSQSKIEQPIF
jgi:hypothetical protein